MKAMLWKLKIPWDGIIVSQREYCENFVKNSELWEKTINVSGQAPKREPNPIGADGKEKKTLNWAGDRAREAPPGL